MMAVQLGTALQQDKLLANSHKIIQAAAGNATGEAVYVDDLFTTTLYKGSGSSQNIVNNIDLDGEGGMVWIKDREVAYWHQIADTERGANKMLSANSSNAESSRTQHLTSFNSNGFTVGSDNDVNYSNSALAAWTFRKQPGFFTVVEQTFSGTTGTVSHDLDSTPGMIIRKRVDNAQNWFVWHRSIPSGNLVYLDLNIGQDSSPAINNVTSTSFGHSGSAGTYVFYIFAHDDQRFGENEDKPIIHCGTYNGNGGGNTKEVYIGWEPQWLLIKKITANSNSNWYIWDSMRGIYDLSGNDKHLIPNLNDYENQTNALELKTNGFNAIDLVNDSGDAHIYVAIRKPMKPPETGSDALQIVSTPYTFSYPVMTASNNNSNTRADVVLNTQRVNSSSLSQPIFMQFLTKVTESYSTSGNITTSSRGVSTSNQNSATSNAPLFYNPKQNPGWLASTLVGSTLYGFKRRPGFFDTSIENISSYTVNGEHDLGVVPEMMLGKRLDANGDFFVFHKDLTKNTDGKVNQNLKLNSSAGPQTATGNGYYQDITTTSYSTYWWPSTTGKAIHYLFATLPGVSKVGSYTGTGSDLNVDCGFTTGARFILIRRSDASGYWYLYDSVRGIVSGNDPFILLSQTGAETTTTDYVDPLSSGFTVTSSASGSINVNGGAYIFLAIA